MIAQERPRLVLRPEHDEWDFITANADLFDAVLIPEGYVAEYPEAHALHGKDHARLLEAAKATGRPVWRDPETPGLVSRTLLSLRSSDRRLLTPAVSVLEGKPLDPQMLGDATFFTHFVDTCLEAQAGCGILVPPYLDFVDLHDSAFHLNLRMVRRAIAAAPGVPVAAFVQVTNYRFLRGVVADAAPFYAATGIERVVIRIRDLDAQTASRDELAAYLDAIEAFAERDIDVTADCTGRLGPVLIAGGAGGFSTGTRFYKKVPYPLLSKREGGGGGEKIAHQAPGTWSEVPREPGVGAGEARVGNLRTLRNLMQLAVENPGGLIASLRSDEANYARDWAAVLDDRLSRAA